MRIKNLLLLASLLLGSQIGTVTAKSAVWKVSDGDNSKQVLYLGGTIHVLSETDYPLPPVFEKAYEAAQTLVFETDIAAVEDPAFQIKMLEILTYQDGQKLSENLSEETLSQLNAFLEERGIPVANFERFTPVGLSLTLTVLELQRLGLGVTGGVDQFFSQRAQQDGKAAEGLETIEEQLGFIQSLEQADSDSIVQSTMNDAAGLNQLWAGMLDAWRTGDMESLEELALEPMERDFPQVANLLIDNRNQAWLKEIPAMMADDDIEFILVGALHMVGEQGLVKQLRNIGYTVEQLK